MSPSSSEAKPRLLIYLRPGLAFRPTRDDSAVIESAHVQIPLAGVPPGGIAALRLLASSGGSEDELCRIAGDAERDSMAACWLMFALIRLRRAGLLRYELAVGSVVLATIESDIDPDDLLNVVIPEDEAIEVSRFASLRRQNDVMALEIPVPQSKVIIREPNCLLLLFHLMRPQRGRRLAESVPGLSSVEVRALTKALYGLKILRAAGEDEAGDARYWEFHDLTLHARSRSWQRLEPTGATFRFGNGGPPVPALKPPPSDARIRLFRPELGRLTRHDITLTAALEQRRSVRQSTGQTITADRLGEFLYRAARVREIKSVPGPEGPVEMTRRPYPAAGGCYELEIYVLAQRCDGLESGLYHYSPEAHELSPIPVPDAHLQQLLAGAEAASAGAMPQILFVITARLPRIAWKYEGIAYALVLKNVGALFQTMYLVATAMGLRPCALGGGDGPLFARATGVGFLSEPSVGEFMLSA